MYIYKTYTSFGLNNRLFGWKNKVLTKKEKAKETVRSICLY